MVDTTGSISIEDAGVPAPVAAPQAKPRAPGKFQQLNKLYTLPAPLRTFPLPTFVPHNPLSWIYMAYVFARQVLQPESSHFPEKYEGFFSADDRCVVVLDERSVRGLWEQGFYGKGSLSRSEPSWLDREKKRRGAGKTTSSEEVTRQRREERQQAKWERARKEREAIDAKRKEEQEAELAILSAEIEARKRAEVLDPVEACMRSLVYWSAWIPSPTSPAELLALPNSSDELPKAFGRDLVHDSVGKPSWWHDALQHWNDQNDSQSTDTETVGGSDAASDPTSIESVPTTEVEAEPEVSLVTGVNGTSHQQHRKSVRFSPTVETTLIEPVIQNQEHFQLTLEEAFFLSYGLGALLVKDKSTKAPLKSSELFTLFRTGSHFGSEQPSPQPDDSFVVSYAVYHHFRSLGWVVRGGIKFSVDFMLYLRGPVFSHAEFAVIIIPSYCDPYWSSTQELKTYVKSKERNWSWLHCVNRVITQVQKTLVLVYVDIPKPQEGEESIPIDQLLARYKIREIILKRWISNRSRD